MQLSDYFDQEIMLAIPVLGGDVPQRVKLVGVEPGGIWVQSQSLTTSLLESVGASSAPVTPTLFFPYGQVIFVSVAVEGSALNEKAFGV